MTEKYLYDLGHMNFDKAFVLFEKVTAVIVLSGFENVQKIHRNRGVPFY